IPREAPVTSADLPFSMNLPPYTILKMSLVILRPEPQMFLCFDLFFLINQITLYQYQLPQKLLLLHLSFHEQTLHSVLVNIVVLLIVLYFSQRFEPVWLLHSHT